MLESFSKSNIDLKIQKFIKASGKDIRAIVVGDSVSVAMERTANKGDFRANISKNGSSRKVELSDEDKDFCVRAAKAVGLEFAGVDIMKDSEGKTYMVEVNGNPGTEIINITNQNYFIDLIKMIENKLISNTNNPQNKNSNDVKSDSNLTNIQRLKSRYPTLIRMVFHNL